MSDKPSGETPAKRKPSLRGGLVIDVTHGKIRVRKWPRSRGKPKTKAEKKRQDDFRTAQRASRYFAPQIMADIERATAGTPLLPRDLTTMMLYNRMYAFQLPTGKVLYPMPARTDVSQSLDTISQTPGDTLVRGEDGWQGQPAGGGGGIGEWTLAGQAVADGTTGDLAITDLGEWSELLYFYDRVTTAADVFRYLTLSTNNGASYWEGTNSYWQLSATGGLSGQSYATRTSTSHDGERTMMGTIIGGPRQPNPLVILPYASSQAVLFEATTDPVNALRIRASSGLTLTGSLTVWTR